MKKFEGGAAPVIPEKDQDNLPPESGLRSKKRNVVHRQRQDESLSFERYASSLVAKARQEREEAAARKAKAVPYFHEKLGSPAARRAAEAESRAAMTDEESERVLDTTRRYLPEEQSLQQRRIEAEFSAENGTTTQAERDESTRSWLKAQQEAEMKERVQHAKAIRGLPLGKEVDVDVSDFGEPAEYAVDFSESGNPRPGKLNKKAEAAAEVARARALEYLQRMVPHAEAIRNLVDEHIGDGVSMVNATDYLQNLANYRQSLKGMREFSEKNEQSILEKASWEKARMDAIERLFSYNRALGIDNNNALVQSVLVPEDVENLLTMHKEDVHEANRRQTLADFRAAVQELLAAHKSKVDREMLDERFAPFEALYEARDMRGEASRFARDIKNSLYEVAEKKLKAKTPEERKRLHEEIQVLAAQYLKEQGTKADSQEKIQDSIEKIYRVKAGMTIAKAQKLLRHPDQVWTATEERIRALGPEIMKDVTDAKEHPATQFVFAIAAYNDAVNRLDNQEVARYRQIVHDMSRALGFDQQGEALINSEMLSYDETLVVKNPFA